jgi:hypothetical protein
MTVTTKKKHAGPSRNAGIFTEDMIQKVILLSVSEMLASKWFLRKSITFLIPGVKLVRIFSIMVIYFFGSAAGMTGFPDSISRTGFFSSVLFSTGLRMILTITVSSAEGFPLPGFIVVFVNLGA